MHGQTRMAGISAGPDRSWLPVEMPWMVAGRVLNSKAINGSRVVSHTIHVHTQVSSEMEPGCRAEQDGTLLIIILVLTASLSETFNLHTPTISTCTLSLFARLGLFGLLLLPHLRNDLVGTVEYAGRGCAARRASGRFGKALDGARRAEVVSAASDDGISVRLSTDDACERDVFVVAIGVRLFVDLFLRIGGELV